MLGGQSVFARLRQRRLDFLLLAWDAQQSFNRQRTSKVKAGATPALLAIEAAHGRDREPPADSDYEQTVPSVDVSPSALVAVMWGHMKNWRQIGTLGERPDLRTATAWKSWRQLIARIAKEAV